MRESQQLGFCQSHMSEYKRTDLQPKREKEHRLEALNSFLSIKSTNSDGYLASKRALSANSKQIIRVYDQVRDILKGDHKVLDWGCRHGVFAFLAGLDFGEAMELHGCDVCDPSEYQDYYVAANLVYQQIRHPWLLDYEADTFDTIIGGGTLEHVPNDSASLTELWRILKPGGVIVITHLPNSTSWTELISRSLFPEQAHKRLYDLTTFLQRLLHHGFLPERWGHHHLMPSALPPSLLANSLAVNFVNSIQSLNYFEDVWPIGKISAASWVVARKCQSF